MLHNIYDYDVKCSKCKSVNFKRVHRNSIQKLLHKKHRYECKDCHKTFYA